MRTFFHRHPISTTYVVDFNDDAADKFSSSPRVVMRLESLGINDTARRTKARKDIREVARAELLEAHIERLTEALAVVFGGSISTSSEVEVHAEMIRFLQLCFKEQGSCVRMDNGPFTAFNLNTGKSLCIIPLVRYDYEGCHHQFIEGF